MVCKCGAMVKASAHRAQITRFGACRHRGKMRRPQDGCRAWLRGESRHRLAGPDAAAVRPVQEFGTIEARSKDDDRIGRRSGARRRARTASAARKRSNAASDSARRTLSLTVGKSAAISPTGLSRPGKQARLAPGLVQEHAAIERLMLGTHDRQPEIGVEMFAGHIGQPQRHDREVPGKFRALSGSATKRAGSMMTSPRSSRGCRISPNSSTDGDIRHSDVSTLMRTEL